MDTNEKTFLLEGKTIQNIDESKLASLNILGNNNKKYQILKRNRDSDEINIFLLYSGINEYSSTKYKEMSTKYYTISRNINIKNETNDLFFDFSSNLGIEIKKTKPKLEVIINEIMTDANLLYGKLSMLPNSIHNIEGGNMELLTRVVISFYVFNEDLKYCKGEINLTYMLYFFVKYCYTKNENCSEQENHINKNHELNTFIVFKHFMENLHFKKLLFGSYLPYNNVFKYILFYLSVDDKNSLMKWFNKYEEREEDMQKAKSLAFNKFFYEKFLTDEEIAPPFFALFLEKTDFVKEVYLNIMKKGINYLINIMVAFINVNIESDNIPIRRMSEVINNNGTREVIKKLIIGYDKNLLRTSVEDAFFTESREKFKNFSKYKKIFKKMEELLIKNDDIKINKIVDCYCKNKKVENGIWFSPLLPPLSILDHVDLVQTGDKLNRCVRK